MAVVSKALFRSRRKYDLDGLEFHRQGESVIVLCNTRLSGHGNNSRYEAGMPDSKTAVGMLISATFTEKHSISRELGRSTMNIVIVKHIEAVPAKINLLI